MKYLLIVLLLVGCSSPVVESNFNSEQTMQEVKEALEAYHQAVNKDGLLAEFEYLDNSADFYWSPPGYSSTLYYDTVRAIIETNAALFTKVNFKWESINIHPLTNQIATFNGVVATKMIDTSGVEYNSRLLESGTVIKRTDGWKLLNGQTAQLNDKKAGQNE